MKLSTKYNRVNVVASILIFLIGCLVFYFVLSYVLIRQLDKSLRSERTEILQYAKEHNALPEIVNTNEQQISFIAIPTPLSNTIYASKKVWVEREKEDGWVRTIMFNVFIAGNNFNATVSKSQLETEELLTLILIIAAIMVAIIITANFIINKIILKKIWQPFYSTIDAISQFQLSKRQVLALPQTNIDEFSLLNRSLNVMTKTVGKEYETLKEFTGNAAHEMQTPLAVIGNTTDAMMQDETVLKNHHQSIGIIGQSVNKLSRLNQSLLLLAKIDNQQFALNETVNWNDIVQQKLQELQELISAQELQLMVDVTATTTAFHHHLADTIISNLINNAIKYNIKNGSIAVTLKNNQLVITNTSILPALETEKVGSRFYRHAATKLNGNGLGLSIVKQICDVAGYTFEYKYIADRHRFIITF